MEINIEYTPYLLKILKSLLFVKEHSYVWKDSGRLIGPPFQRKGPIDSCSFFRSFIKMGRHFFLILCMLEVYKFSKVTEPEFCPNLGKKSTKWPKNEVFRIGCFLL